MKIFPFLFILFLLHTAQAQIKTVKVNVKSLPKSLFHKGDTVINATSYTDKNGEQLIITTESFVGKKNEDGITVNLNAYHYKVNNGNYTLTWQMHDFLKQCDADYNADFLPGTFAVTDLNNDGIAEVWLMYKLACRSDVSPAVMKIIMHEGDKKYAVRGESKVKIGSTDYMGGSYTLDEAFKSGPGPFENYARQLWKKNMIDTFN